ncbi:uncharacterized protein [Dermacentor andersoni]|uniref:uncharacterized protein isoform X2 n=1 Tax=Dermacentor andersoni TaxID=34620 RepID=UPI002417D57F|nr:uncharacterized protein LOC126547734 isoform X2 [Dermacentor andersoni]
MRGDGETGQATPQRGSTRGILPPVPGAPVKKRNRRQSAKGTLKPKRLVYNVSQTEEGTQDTSECLDSSQEMQELLEARISTVEGTWVQCDNPECNKWRYLADVIDPSELPQKWFCSMNSDPKHNTCEAEEDDQPDDDLLEAKYFVGSIVWAKVNTYPWWPAMIDDDPDLGVYEWREGKHDLPTSYHVTFLDQKVTRAWVRDRFCVSFRQAHNHDGPAGNKVPGYYRKMLDAAVATAEKALKMPVAERIKSYCFLNRYRGTQKSSVQAPKEERPRGRPRKTPAPDTQPGKDETAAKSTQEKRPRGRPRKIPTPDAQIGKDAKAAKPRQGVKRPRAQFCTNIQKASNQAEELPPKQSRKTTEQGKITPRGRPRKVNASPTPPSTEAVTSEVTQDVKRPRGRPRKILPGESDKSAHPCPKKPKPKACSKQVLELEREKMEPGDYKKACANLAASAKCILKQPAKGKLSAILSKKRIEEAKQGQTCEKGFNTNQSSTTASSILTVTTASGKTKHKVQDTGMTASQRNAEHKSQSEDAGATSEQSLFTSPTDHESPDSMTAMAYPQPTKKPGCAFKMFTITNPVEKKDKDSVVRAGVPPDSVTESDGVKLRIDTELTHAPPDNATVQAEPDSDKSPTRTKADCAKPLVPRRDSTEAQFVLSIPSFDSAEAQPECYDVNSLIEFLDDDRAVGYKPMLGSLNKAGKNTDASKPNQLLLPFDPMDIEPPMDTLPIEEPMNASRCNSNDTSQPWQPQPVALRTAPKVALIEQPVQRASSGTEVQAVVLSGTGPQSNHRVEEPDEVSAGAAKARGVKTASKASTPADKQSAISRVKRIHLSNNEDTAAATWNESSSSSPETSTSEQEVDKVKGVAVTEDKENHVSPSAIVQNTVPAKKGKAISKPNRALHEMVPPKAPLAKKSGFKVPTKEVTSKAEAKILQAAALVNGGLPRASTSKVAKAKLQASLANLSGANSKASSSKATEAKPQAVTADVNATHFEAGSSEAAEVNLQSALSHTNEVQSRASTSTLSADTNTPAALVNTDEAQPKLTTGCMADSEDSDFESLSNTQELTFEDTLSSISQSLEMSQEEDSDFASLEGIDGSQSFDMEE